MLKSLPLLLIPSLTVAWGLLPPQLSSSSDSTIATTTSSSSSNTNNAFLQCPSPLRRCINNSRNDRMNNNSRLNMSIPNPIDTFTSGLSSIARLPFGVTVSTNTNTNNNENNVRIEALYDLESSRECRIVRERLTELDLVIERLVPYASDSRARIDPDHEFAMRGEDNGLQVGVPLMVVSLPDNDGYNNNNDGNNNNNGGLRREKKLVGSDEIMTFLDDTYGPREDRQIRKHAREENPLSEFLMVSKTIANVLTSYLPSLLRLGRGNDVAKCAKGDDVPRPAKPLVLYSYEGNQFCRLVREVLCELDVVYEVRNVGKGSPRRESDMAQLTGGSTQCPFLLDPNTGVQMDESRDVVEYLYQNYAKWTPPNEGLQLISSLITPVAKPIFEILSPLQAGSYKEDKKEYESKIEDAKSTIEREVASDAVVIYTYSLSPFCTEAMALLDNLDVPYTEISLGMEWIPGLIDSDGGSEKRAALGRMTGQTSLPHVFVGGKSVGGLFSGKPGLVPLLEEDGLLGMVNDARAMMADPSLNNLKELEGVGSFE